MTKSKLFGWDLPPGVSMSDLPGNGPEEQQAEAFADEFYDLMEKLLKELGPPKQADDKFTERLLEWVWKRIGDAYANGYRNGSSDESMARDQLAEQRSLAEKYSKNS